MKKLFNSFVLTLMFAFAAQAEEDNPNTSKNIFLRPSPIKDKITVRLTNSINTGIGKEVKLDRDLYRYDASLSLRMSNFRAELNYGLLSCLEVGAYFGYSNMGDAPASLRHTADAHPYHLLNYGGQVNFHPISLFLRQNRSGWDLWMSYKCGLANQFGGYKKSSFENGFGAGIAFFPFKKQNLGFHFEYNTGKWEAKQGALRRKGLDHDFRWGISYKFGK